MNQRLNHRVVINLKGSSLDGLTGIVDSYVVVDGYVMAVVWMEGSKEIEYINVGCLKSYNTPYENAR